MAGMEQEVTHMPLSDKGGRVITEYCGEGAVLRFPRPFNLGGGAAELTPLGRGAGGHHEVLREWGSAG